MFSWVQRLGQVTDYFDGSGENTNQPPSNSSNDPSGTDSSSPSGSSEVLPSSTSSTIFEVEDSLPPLELLTSYSRGQIHQKLFLLHRLPELYAALSQSDLATHFLPTLIILSEDSSPLIKQTLIGELPGLIRLACDSTSPSFAFHLLPILFPPLSAQDSATKLSAMEALISLFPFFSENSDRLKESEDLQIAVLEEMICPQLFNLLKSPNEDLRLSGLHLLKYFMLELDHVDFLENEFLSFLILLSKDIFGIRRQVASFMGDLVRFPKMPNFKETPNFKIFDETVLQVFEKLSKDEIWGVRKGCTESIAGISEFCSATNRKEVLLPTFLRFLKNGGGGDKGIFVKVGMFQNCGNFLVTLKEDELEGIAEDFLNIYATTILNSGKMLEKKAKAQAQISDMDEITSVRPTGAMDPLERSGSIFSPVPARPKRRTNTSKIPSGNDAEILEYCAFHFPAILLCFGNSDRWKNFKLKNIFELFVFSPNPKLRRPIAYALHEITSILIDRAENEQQRVRFGNYFSKIFHHFFKNEKIPDVKKGIVKKLSFFIHLKATLPSTQNSSDDKQGTSEELPDELSKSQETPSVEDVPQKKDPIFFFLPFIESLAHESTDWRFRKLLAVQIGAIIVTPNLPYSVIHDSLFPLWKQLLFDVAWSVRRRTVKSSTLEMISALLKEDGENPTRKRDISAVVDTIKHFGMMNSGHDRMVFVKMVGRMIKGLDEAEDDKYGEVKTVLKEVWIPKLTQMVIDKVPNIRMEVAKIFYRIKITQKDKYGFVDKEVEEAIESLKHDKDKETNTLANMIE